MLRRALIRAAGPLMGILVCLPPLTACASHPTASDGFGELTVDQVEQMIQKKEADIFDNNSEERYQKSHLPGATWVKFNEVKASDLPKDKSRALVFYCANTH